MLNHHRNFFKLLYALFILLLLVSPAAAQQEEGTQLQISQIDISNFPEVAIRVTATDAENNQIADLSSLSVSENGTDITDFSTNQVAVGTDIIFVIDANIDIEQVDEGSTLTRREKVRDSINNYANNIMDDSGQDDSVSIVVPDGETGRFLEMPNMTFPNEVINAINFYETGELAATPLNQMMEVALDQAEENQANGRYQAIFLYTDGGLINTQLDYPALTERANALGVTIYSAILGLRADPNEITNVTQLTDPTGGTYVHMPESADATPLFESIDAKAVQTQIVYRSTTHESGPLNIAVSLAGTIAESSVDLTVEPATITIPLDNSQPIRRVAVDADTPLEEMEPTTQPLAAEVSWPDGYPRSLNSATLLVNGEEVNLDSPVLDNNGLLTFEWNISRLDAGEYELQVRLVDELGLESLSSPLPLTIEIDRPGAPETAEPTSETPVVEEETNDPEADTDSGSIVDTLQENIAFVAIGVGGLLFLIILVVVIIIIMRRRRGSEPQEAYQGAATAAMPSPAVPPLGNRMDDSPATMIENFDADATFLMQPDFALQQVVGGAYLEPMEYAPEHTGMIPLVGNNVALGRDPNLVQIPFNDRSVSRLHARIMESGGVYRLYDEGSASGTYLNYERIGLTPRVINDKDDLHFGRVHLKFHIAAPQPEQPDGDDSTQILQSPGMDDENDATDTQVYFPPN